MDRKTIEITLKKYVEKIKTEIKPQSIILYGSFARGTANEWSDIDIMVITDFEKKNEFKLMNKLSDIGSKIDSERIFDVRVLRNKEFTNLSHLSILSEVKKEGVVIYTN
ncbi:MAG: nucleotidyltransferase domain-containing protein [Patescibacteria group bacterium]